MTIINDSMCLCQKRVAHNNLPGCLATHVSTTVSTVSDAFVIRWEIQTRKKIFKKGKKKKIE